jgi:hypothetical protein
MSDLFLHDWGARPTVSTEWSTDVVAAADTLVEERQGLVGRPRRTVSVRWVAVRRAEANRLLWLLMRTCGPANDTPIEVPLYPDVVVTTTSSSGTTINCPTENRRFHVGGRVVIHELVAGRASNPQWRTITAVDPTSITVSVALTGTYAAGALVYPTLKVRTILDAQLTARTDQVADVSVSLSEILGSALPAFCAYADLADYGFTTAPDADENELFVLDLGPDWATAPGIRAVRSGRVDQLGRDESVLARGPRAQLEITYSLVSADRDAHARMLAFFDAHRGRLASFFALNPLTVWAIEGIGTTYVDVTIDGDAADPLDLASYVAVRMRDGTLYVRPIETVAETGGNLRITLAVELPTLSANDVALVTLAHQVRFANDFLEEEWQTNGVATTRVVVTEIQPDRVVSVDDGTWSEPACEV